MKRFVAAVIITFALVYCFGHVIEQCFDWYLEIDGHVVNTMSVLIGVGLAVIVLLALGFLLAFSIFGVLAFVLFVALGSVLVAGLSLIWPIALVVVFIAWLVKSKPENRSHYSYRAR